MPRNISFALTTPQFIAGTKDVTRRMGWLHAKVGDELMACEKCQGLGKGGTIKHLGLIRLVDVRREPLSDMTVGRHYGWHELAREGFPDKTPEWFVDMFCASHKGCVPSSIVTRLEFIRL